MSDDLASPPSWLPDATQFDSSAWRLLVGDFDVRTATGPDVTTRGLRTVMRSRAAAEPSRVVGSDEDLDPDPAKTSRWPVELRGDTLLVGGTRAGDGPSEYRVQWASPTGFCGEWRTRQPEWLREHQPGHPEFGTGPFLATRRSRAAEQLPNVCCT